MLKLLYGPPPFLFRYGPFLVGLTIYCYGIPLDIKYLAVDIGCLALAGNELAEAIEATRVPCQDDHIPFFNGQEAEVADAIIRLLDFAAARNLRVVDAMLAKADYNRNRSRMHGGKLA